MNAFHTLVFGRRFQTLPAALFRQVEPTPLADPYPIIVNPALCAELGLDPDSLYTDAARAVLSGTSLPPAVMAVAGAYAGHQFGHYVPQLGDGRALLLGDVARADGGRAEIQLKGAGPTPFSRHADGRAVLRSSIREYLCSEAMHGLGIPTTRALCLFGSDERVARETMETTAVVARVADSFLRFGHFEWCCHSGRNDLLKELVDHATGHFFPGCRLAEQPVLALFREVVARTARLIAQWQSVGFCHGVMNTDNMSLLGLTLDYGPFGFIDTYRSDFVCNHSDDVGRYAFNEQPRVGLWNLYALASALLPLQDEAALRSALDEYEGLFRTAWLARMRAKLGLDVEHEDDGALIERLLSALESANADFTVFFRRLCDFAATGSVAVFDGVPDDGTAFYGWLEQYRERLELDGGVCMRRACAMRRVNPCYVLRNHLAQRAIEAARDARDYGEIERLARCLAHPYDESAEFADYAVPPPRDMPAVALSCSS
ncbi:protein adenylyltransferase SelO [Paludibacterium yongneupense]|uniref:protein adenylyltransferase SelO n=1 Tax=Paludibacterium yongneupense TaxID=400061 RepID=UPI0003FE70B0|nr:YdiU family protein [Paludibacterium yongneupense]